MLLAECYLGRDDCDRHCWSPPLSLFARPTSRSRTTRSVGDLHSHTHTGTSLLEQVSSVKQRYKEYGAVWSRGVPHGSGEGGTVHVCDGRASFASGTVGTDGKRRFRDAKRDGLC